MIKSRILVKTLTFGVLCIVALNGLATAATEYDLVVINGRVMDPETGLDNVRQVGISDGKIVAISSEPLQGKTTLDADGLVVAPGFIDLHAHGQDSVSNRLQAADGVTTALEMEIGVYPVGSWLASREGKALINFGATVGHLPARVKLMNGIDIGHPPTLSADEAARLNATDRAYEYKEATPDQINELTALMTKGLDEGGLGLGFGITYTPGASRLEILRLFEMAADKQVAAYVHLRGANSGGTLGAFQEVISNAATTGASVHIVHMNSSAGESARVTIVAHAARIFFIVSPSPIQTRNGPLVAASAADDPGRFRVWRGRRGLKQV